MNTPAWLQAAGLVLWGFAAGQPVLGLLLAGIRLLIGMVGLKPSLSDRQLERTVDLSALAVGVLIAAELAIAGLPRGLLAAAGWLPVALLPLIIVDAINTTPLRWRHLAFALRRSVHPDAQRPARPAAAWLAATLLAASLLAPRSPWFFWALATLLIAWLATAQAPRRRRHLAPAFVVAAVLAGSLGFVGSRGLHQAHLMLQQWVVDTLSGDPTDPYQRQTRIGDLGEVKNSDRIIWRVVLPRTEGSIRLLRNGVFTQYRKGTWSIRRDHFAAEAAPPSDAPIRLRLLGESRKGLAHPPLPQDAGSFLVPPDSTVAFQQNAYGARRIEQAPPRLDLAVAASAPIAAAPPDAGDLALPPDFPGLFARLPELTPLAGRDEATKLAGIEAFFAEHFRYTLYLGGKTDAPRDLERFLLTDRAGHCEYFATATVLILRALGIPARYVTGYSMQEFSRLEKTWLLRDRHAHAWVEAHISGRWVEVDTTPPDWLAAEEKQAPIWQPASDFFSFVWHRLQDWRDALLARPTSAGTSTTGEFVLLAALLLGALAGFRWWRRRAAAQSARTEIAELPDLSQAIAGHPDVIEFRQLEARLGALGWPRRPTETPAHWIARVLREGGAVIDPADRKAAGSVVLGYYRLRYGSAQ